MVSISINRAKYRTSKSTATWLDKFFEAQIKEPTETRREIQGKEVISKGFNIVPWKLFELAKQNGHEFAGIKKQVDDGVTGAIGRARMILSSCLKRKIAKGETIKDVEGKEVPQDEAYTAYRASITPSAGDASTVSAAAPISDSENGAHAETENVAAE